jgi:hypothetical protein
MTWALASGVGVQRIVDLCLRHLVCQALARPDTLDFGLERGELRSGRDWLEKIGMRAAGAA